jgi:hypothetical protein
MELSETTIKRLLNQAEGKEFIKFIESKIKSLDRVSDIKNTSKEQIAIEVIARTRASKKLAEILKPLIEHTELSEIEEPETY